MLVVMQREERRETRSEIRGSQKLTSYPKPLDIQLNTGECVRTYSIVGNFGNFAENHQIIIPYIVTPDRSAHKLQSMHSDGMFAKFNTRHDFPLKLWYIATPTHTSPQRPKLWYQMSVN